MLSSFGGKVPIAQPLEPVGWTRSLFTRYGQAGWPMGTALCGEDGEEPGLQRSNPGL